jgi:light-harvesting complex I chlorophyll a/b binding protein 4
VKNPDFAGGLVGSDVEAIAFDPWKLSAERDAEGLAWYRAAELKHGRICMLAALGLFVQSLYHLPDDVFSNPKGLDALFQVSAERPQAIAQILIAIGAIEVAGLAANDGKAPGDYGFDPLGLKPKTEEAFEELQLKEIKNGRCVRACVRLCALCISGSFLCLIAWLTDD